MNSLLTVSFCRCPCCGKEEVELLDESQILAGRRKPICVVKCTSCGKTFRKSM